MALALLCGTTLGLGLWSLVSLMPRLARPRLVDRVAPYVLDVSAEARLFVGRRSTDPIPVLGSLFAPVFGRGTNLLSRVLGGSDTVRQRLQQAGSTRSLQQFRSEQLLWGVAGFAGGVFIVVVSPAFSTVPLVVRVLCPLVAAGCAGLARDLLLQRAAKARLVRMESELPTVLEFLTLSLSAGEGILDSLRRVAARHQLRRALARTRRGDRRGAHGRSISGCVESVGHAAPASSPHPVRRSDHERARARFTARRGLARAGPGRPRRGQTAAPRNRREEGGPCSCHWCS